MAEPAVLNMKRTDAIEIAVLLVIYLPLLVNSPCRAQAARPPRLFAKLVQEMRSDNGFCGFELFLAHVSGKSITSD